MITDPDTGQTVTFVPVNLVEGGESDVITLDIAPEVSGALLRSGVDASAKIKARISPSAFQDIGASPLDLSAFFGSSVAVDFKVVAATPLPGVTRSYLSAGISKQAAAAWRN